jgi:protein-S-isoprenylcysteine O-methyltransferase
LYVSSLVSLSCSQTGYSPISFLHVHADLAFLLTNGHAYTIAHLTGILEYTLTSLLSSPTFRYNLHAFGWHTSLGLGLVLAGQTFRSMAMIHASHSFSHHIQVRKREDHVLVKTGIYAYAPSLLLTVR